jgi:hypothetical protein
MLQFGTDVCDREVHNGGKKMIASVFIHRQKVSQFKRLVDFFQP